MGHESGHAIYPDKWLSVIQAAKQQSQKATYPIRRDHSLAERAPGAAEFGGARAQALGPEPTYRLTTG